MLQKTRGSVDPISSLNIRNFIKKETLEILGGTIILATHRLDEASDLCDRVAIMNKGDLAACGSKEELAAFYRRPVQYDLELKDLNGEALERINQLDFVRKFKKIEKIDGQVKVTITMDNEKDDIHRILSEIIRNKGRIQKCTRIEPSLENVFFEAFLSTEIHQQEKQTS